MAILFSSKLEEIARQNADTAGYSSVDTYLEELLLEQHAEQQWILSNSTAIDARIEAALASEGKGLDHTPEEASQQLEARLRRHFAERSVA